MPPWHVQGQLRLFLSEFQNLTIYNLPTEKCTCIYSNFQCIIKVLLPTDAQKKCLKSIVKLTLKMLQHVSVQSPSSGSALYELAKVAFVKSQLKCVGVVYLVVWLHVLSGPCWCVSHRSETESDSEWCDIHTQCYQVLAGVCLSHRLETESVSERCDIHQQGPDNTCSHTIRLTTLMYFN